MSIRMTDITAINIQTITMYLGRERVTMEKPRKKETYEHREVDGMTEVDSRYNAGWNDHDDAMSTWLEGEVPTVEQVAYAIREVIFESDEVIVQDPGHNADPNKRYISLRAARKLAGNVHALLLRKLTGKV